jgi:hypothetical protein
MRFAGDTIAIAIHILAISRFATIDGRSACLACVIATVPMISGLWCAFSGNSARCRYILSSGENFAALVGGGKRPASRTHRAEQSQKQPEADRKRLIFFTPMMPAVLPPSAARSPTALPPVMMLGIVIVLRSSHAPRTSRRK